MNLWMEYNIQEEMLFYFGRCGFHHESTNEQFPYQVFISHVVNGGKKN